MIGEYDICTFYTHAPLSLTPPHQHITSSFKSSKFIHSCYVYIQRVLYFEKKREQIKTLLISYLELLNCNELL